MKIYSQVWLTTFGDLLTLLLCFSVVAIYQSAKEAHIKNQSKQIVSQTSDAQANNIMASGKQIASKDVTEFPHPGLSLSQEDFSPSFAGLNEAGALKLRDFAEQNKGELEVGVCDVGFDYSEAAFETLKNRLPSHPLRFSMGASVCKSMWRMGLKSPDEEILVSAYTRNNHG